MFLYNNMKYTVILVHRPLPYTMRAFSLEHKLCYNIVTGKEKYIYILEYMSPGTFYYEYKIVVP